MILWIDIVDNNSITKIYSVIIINISTHSLVCDSPHDRIKLIKDNELAIIFWFEINYIHVMTLIEYNKLIFQFIKLNKESELYYSDLR